MSQVKIQGNASGTGIFTVAAPNSNTDITLTLPDGAGTLDRLERAGNILQVVQGSTTTATTTASTSFVSTTLAASITPSSANSKILIFGQIHVVGGLSTSQPNITLYRGGTNLIATSYGFGNTYTDTGGYSEWLMPFSLLDSPASASSITYTIYGRNASGASTAAFGNSSRTSIITLLEIAG